MSGQNDTGLSEHTFGWEVILTGHVLYKKNKKKNI